VLRQLRAVGGAGRWPLRACAADDGSFRIDWQKFSDALSPRTRMIILNSPHNPSGALISRADLDQLAR
jgi:aspartate/methionine/tyrosine aminotransferase